MTRRFHSSRTTRKPGTTAAMRWLTSSSRLLPSRVTTRRYASGRSTPRPGTTAAMHCGPSSNTRRRSTATTAPLPCGPPMRRRSTTGAMRWATWSATRRRWTVMSRALAASPRPCGDASRTAGVALGHLGQYSAALGSYDRAITLRPDDAETWSNRGVALAELDRLPEAIASYDQAIRCTARLCGSAQQPRCSTGPAARVPGGRRKL